MNSNKTISNTEVASRQRLKVWHRTSSYPSSSADFDFVGSHDVPDTDYKFEDIKLSRENTNDTAFI